MTGITFIFFIAIFFAGVKPSFRDVTLFAIFRAGLMPNFLGAEGITFDVISLVFVFLACMLLT